MSQTARIKLPGGCVALIGLPFFAAGIFVLLLAARSWWIYFDSSDWTLAPAEILSVELKTNRGLKGSTADSVTCRYRYVFAGKEYESAQVGVAGYGSGDRDLQMQRFQSLETARICKVSWPALVDPSDPARALLIREVDFSMVLMLVLGLLFAGGGGGIIFRGIAGDRRGRPVLA